MAQLAAILDQLGVDKTFYVQIALFAILFLVLGPLYFKPFLALFQARHQRTVEDREAAQKMMEQAQAKLEEYRRRIQEERIAARKDVEAVLLEAKRAEAEILSAARAEAKKIQQETLESVERQRSEISAKLDAEVMGMAQSLSSQLLARKG